MNIENISKSEKQVTLTLNKDELVMLCNIMYGAKRTNEDETKRELFHKTYADMMLARDLSQYGHIDNFSLAQIIKERNSCSETPEGILSDEDIDTFNSYLEDNDMETAFGNSDFTKIYKKIVGFHGTDRSDKIKNWIQKQEV